MGKVSAVVVTYNRLELLRECITSLLNQDLFLDNIFVINNNSSDGTREYLNEISQQSIIRPVHLDKNIGGAGGFSFGIKTAVEQSESDYFLILDDDTMVKKQSIVNLVRKADELDFGFLCSDVRWYKDGNACLLNCPEVTRDWNAKLNDNLIKVKSASFVSFMVSRKNVIQFGLPISEMFIWADDAEYSIRLSNKKDSYFVPDSEVVHKCKNNINDESVINCDPERIYYYECMYRNRMYLYRKHYGFKYVLMYFADYIVSGISALFKSNDNRIKRFYSVLKGTFKGLLFNPKIRFPRV